MEDDPFAEFAPAAKAHPFQKPADDDPFAEFDSFRPAVGPSTETAIGQRGLSRGTAFPKEVQDEDAQKSVWSWPVRAATAAVGALGDIDQTGRDLDNTTFGKWVNSKLGTTPTDEETPLPTQDSLLQRARGMVSPEVADTFLHEAFTPAGKTVQTTLDLAGPGLAAQTRRVTKAGIRALDPGPRLAESVNRQYGILQQAGVGYDPGRYTVMANRIRTEIGNSNLSPQVRQLVDNMASDRMLNRMGGNPIYADEIEETYKRAGYLSGRGSDNDRRVAGMIRDELDEFRRGPVISGNMSGEEAVQRLEQARYDASRNIKDKRLRAVERRASRVAPDQASAETRNRINMLLRDESFAGNLSPEELVQIQRVASRGNTVEDLLTTGGNLGHVLRGASAAAVTGSQGGDWKDSILAGIVGGALGRGASRYGARRRRNALSDARSLVRAGPRRMDQARAANAAPAGQRALLAGTGISVLPSSGSSEPMALLPDGSIIPLSALIPQDEKPDPANYPPGGIRG